MTDDSKTAGAVGENTSTQNTPLPSINHHLPTLIEYDMPRDEMIGTVLKVEQLLKNGVPGGDIGIIYKENKYGEELATYLRLRNVPYYSKRSLNLLDHPLMRQLLLVLDYLRAEHEVPYGGDDLLFELLHFEWLNIPPIEIAKASMKVAEQRYKKGGSSLRQWMCEEASKPQMNLFDEGLHQGLKDACTMIESLVGSVPNHTVQTLLEKVVREAGFLGHIMQQQEKARLMQLLTGFYNWVKGETGRNAALTLDGLLHRIDMMRKEGVGIPLIEVSGNERGVNLMTAHGSKGLEFEHVFFLSTTAGVWEKKKKPGGGFAFPDTLLATKGGKGEAANVEEMRRLFYVALTRAKQHLYISYPRYGADGKEAEPSMFLAEILQGHKLPQVTVRHNDKVQTEFSALQFKSQSPEVEHLDDELVDRIVQNFGLSASSLNAYLKCPLGFYYQYIVRIPSPSNEAMEFGSAVHYALETLFNKMLESGATAADGVKRFPPLDDFLQDFVRYLYRHRESFTREEFARRKDYGLEMLTTYYNHYVTRWNKVVVVERAIRGVQLDGIPLKGKIDKIEFNGKEATVIDYKTGNPDYADKKLARPGRDPLGGDYWRQAVFYKILLDLYGNDWNIKVVEFDYVEPDGRKQFHKKPVAISVLDVEAVKQQIHDTYNAIQRKQFYKGCGKDDCHWCNFVKTNKLAVALHDLIQEEPPKPFLRAVEGGLSEAVAEG